MQKLEPAKGAAGDNHLLPVEFEKARIEHAQVHGEHAPGRALPFLSCLLVPLVGAELGRIQPANETLTSSLNEGAKP